MNDFRFPFSKTIGGQTQSANAAIAANPPMAFPQLGSLEGQWDDNLSANPRHPIVGRDHAHHLLQSESQTPPPLPQQQRGGFPLAGTPQQRFPPPPPFRGETSLAIPPPQLVNTDSCFLLKTNN